MSGGISRKAFLQAGIAAAMELLFPILASSATVPQAETQDPKITGFAANVIKKYKVHDSFAHLFDSNTPTGVEIITAALNHIIDAYTRQAGALPVKERLPVKFNPRMRITEGDRSDAILHWMGNNIGTAIGAYLATNVDMGPGSPSKNDIARENRFRIYWQLETGDQKTVRRFMQEFIPEKFEAGFNELIAGFFTGDLGKVGDIVRSMTETPDEDAWCHEFVHDQNAKDTDIREGKGKNGVGFDESPDGEGSGRIEIVSAMSIALNVGIHSKDRYNNHLRRKRENKRGRSAQVNSSLAC